MPAYLTFRVSLLRVKPAPWREFVLPKDSTFELLHEAIQDACGWSNDHLYAFRAAMRGPVIAGVPVGSGSSRDPSAARVTLTSHFQRAGDACVYEYDFGDGWLHDVTLAHVSVLPEGFERKLIGGARAFPPEDCGGIPGYEQCVAIVCQGSPGQVHLQFGQAGPPPRTGKSRVTCSAGPRGPERKDREGAPGTTALQFGQAGPLDRRRDPGPAE